MLHDIWDVIIGQIYCDKTNGKHVNYIGCDTQNVSFLPQNDNFALVFGYDGFLKQQN